MATKPPFEDPQVARAFLDGKIGPDGIGLPQPYPRMMYKKGKASDHVIADQPLKIGGQEVTTRLVNDANEEAEALSSGWFFSPDLKLTPEQEKDAELARLRAQVDKTKAKENA